VPGPRCERETRTFHFTQRGAPSRLDRCRPLGAVRAFLAPPEPPLGKVEGTSFSLERGLGSARVGALLLRVGFAFWIGVEWC
jgi:hypothetical protein